ncbi:hypothetical protein ORJ66_10540 [Pseudoalteromonas tunicata]|uniref:hypothetical protein n=1 Tax=Pseudoalteromonas tunicata TaxID=314281 RepID=UPI00273CFFBA|nr:hypothetical protein [Pseudoalteromonas tunicata]MDP5213479.1 hypothetical protein [Pseudoalteromonas tunicata]
MLKKILAVMMISLLLSGCNTTPIKNTDIQTNQFDVNNGIVAVQVINNTNTLNQLHKNWTELIIIRTDNIEQLKNAAIEKAKLKSKHPVNENKIDWEPEYFTLQPHPEGLIDSQIFLGALPQGEYLIANLYSFYNGGDFTSWLTMPVMAAAGKFEIKAKQLTNLGSIVFQPLLDIKQESFWRNESSQKAYVTRVEEQQDLNSFILKHYPNLEKNVDLTQVLGWKNDELNSFRNKLSQLSRENAYGEAAISLKKHAKSLIASKFGLIRWQDHAGIWHKTNIKSNSQFNAALEFEDKIAVAGELGQVFITDKLGNEWQRFTPVSSKEAITWLAKGHSHYYALSQSATNYTLYEFDDITQPWKNISEFKRRENNFFEIMGGVFPFINKAGLPTVVSDNKVSAYEPQTNKWIKYKSSAMVKLSQLNSGTLIGVELSQWDGVGDQVVSYDDAKTWHKVARKLDLFGNNKVDLSLPAEITNEQILSLGKVGKDPELKIITANKIDISKHKLWQAHANAKAGCHTLLPQLTAENTVYFLCAHGAIVSTSDFGQTWQDIINIDIKEMQDNYDLLIKALQAEAVIEPKAK